MLENGFIKRVAVLSILLMVFVIVFSSVLSKNKEEVSENKVNPTMLDADPFNQFILNSIATPVPIIPEEIVSLETVWDQISGVKESSVFEQLTKHVIVIKKPAKLDAEAFVQFEELPVDRQISLTFSRVKDPDLTFNEIYRVLDNEVYYDIIPTPSPTPTPTPTLTPSPSQALSPSLSPLLTSEPTNPSQIVDIEDGKEYNIDETKIVWSDPIQSLTTKILNEDELYTVVLTLNLNKTYAYEFYEDETYCYICLNRPKDVYSKIIVIDAGHGGLDSGTYSEGYKYLEKNMNLDMALFLEEFLVQEEDIKVYMTRTTDRRLTLNQRVNLANDVEADFFISIHCNSNPSSKVNGLEVLYNEEQNSWTRMNSKQFSIICEEEAVKSIGLKSRGIVPRGYNVHIIGKAKMPVALIEVAFMTNEGDLEVLLQERKRRDLAMGLYKAILRAYEEVEESK